jgi:hypothetical protein
MGFLLETRMDLEGFDLVTRNGQDSRDSEVYREAGPKVSKMSQSLKVFIEELKRISFTYLQLQ